jgi:hypothetical protein
VALDPRRTHYSSRWHRPCTTRSRVFSQPARQCLTVQSSIRTRSPMTGVILAVMERRMISGLMNRRSHRILLNKNAPPRACEWIYSIVKEFFQGAISIASSLNVTGMDVSNLVFLIRELFRHIFLLKSDTSPIPAHFGGTPHGSRYVNYSMLNISVLTADRRCSRGFSAEIVGRS